MHSLDVPLWRSHVRHPRSAADRLAPPHPGRRTRAITVHNAASANRLATCGMKFDAVVSKKRGASGDTSRRRPSTAPLHGQRRRYTRAAHAASSTASIHTKRVLDRSSFRGRSTNRLAHRKSAAEHVDALHFALSPEEAYLSHVRGKRQTLLPPTDLPANQRPESASQGGQTPQLSSPLQFSWKKEGWNSRFTRKHVVTTRATKAAALNHRQAGSMGSVLLGGQLPDMTFAEKLAAQIDRAFTEATASTSSHVSGAQLQSITAPRVHKSMKYVYQRAIQQVARHDIELAEILGRIWTEHVAVLHKTCDDLELDASRRESHLGLAGDLDDNLQQRWNAIVEAAARSRVGARPDSAQQAKAVTFQVQDSPTTSELESSSGKSAFGSPRLGPKRLSPLNATSSLSLRETASPLAGEVLNSIDELYDQLSSMRRLRNVIFSSHSRHLRARDAGWELTRQLYLRSSWDSPEFSGSAVRGEGFWVLRKNSLQGDEYSWKWHMFRTPEAKLEAIAAATKIQCLTRAFQALRLVTSLRLQSLGALQRVDFHRQLRNQVRKRRSMVEQKRHAEEALREILWETKRFVRDMVAGWWKNLRSDASIDTALREEVQTTKARLRRTSQVLNNLASRALELLDHQRAQRKQMRQRHGGEESDSSSGESKGDYLDPLALLESSTLDIAKAVEEQLSTQIVQQQQRVVQLIDTYTQTDVTGSISEASSKKSKPKAKSKLSSQVRRAKRRDYNSDGEDHDRVPEDEKHDEVPEDYYGSEQLDFPEEGAEFMNLLRALKNKKQKPRPPTLKSVMSTILDIYIAKIDFDQQSDRDGVARVGMPKFIYQYYFRRFGLRKLAEQHMVNLNAAFRKYKKEPRVRIFARWCGVFGKLDRDCLDFVLLILANAYSKDKSILEELEDGSCWMSETRAVGIVRYAADVLIHSGPQIVNSMGVSSSEMFDAMLQDVSQSAVHAHFIITSVVQRTAGGGGLVRKVVTRLSRRPDFSMGVRHLASAMEGAGASAKIDPKNLPQPRPQKQRTPHEIFLDSQAAKTSQSTGETKSSKTKEVKLSDAAKVHAKLLAEAAAAGLDASWLMLDEEHTVRGRDEFAISLDEIIRICLVQFLALRRQMKARLKLVFRDFDARRHHDAGASFDDFALMVFQVDPTVSTSASMALFETCIEKAAAEHRLKHGEDDENEDITPSAWVKTAVQYGLLRGWSKTFGKRVRATNGQRSREIESNKQLIEKVKLLKSLDPRQKHKLAGQFRKVNFTHGQYIVTQGDPGDAFYVIQEGLVKIAKKLGDGTIKEIVTLKKGDFFGERALLTNEPRSANCIAEQSVQCLVLGRDEFDETLGPLEAIMRKASREFDRMFAEWDGQHKLLTQKVIESIRMEKSTVETVLKNADPIAKLRMAAQIQLLNQRIVNLESARDELEEKLVERSDAADARRCFHRLLVLVTNDGDEQEAGGEDSGDSDASQASDEEDAAAFFH